VKQSIEISPDLISESVALLGMNLHRRLQEKGFDSFVNSQEAFGATMIEMRALEAAIESKDPKRIMDKLMDVSVGCIFGVASIKAHARLQDQKKPVQGEKP
jgi:hypothetical protein